MKNKTKKKDGFTLIELIVSVTIIAVLTVVGVISYTGASQKARDGRRIADLEKIRIALELYRQDVGAYPASLSLLETKYIQKVPTGPKGEIYSNGYSNSTSFTYSLGINVENLGSTNVATKTCGTISDCNYEVNNP